jgi:hypothetical protein
MFRHQTWSSESMRSLIRQVIDPLIEPAPVIGQSLDDPYDAKRQHMVGMARMRRGAQESKTLPNSDAALQEEGTNL